MGNSFGSLFRISTFGESHGPAIGVVIDGCPSGLPLEEAPIQQELDRRRPGQSHLTTQRQEADRVEILSGLFDGKTTGQPLALLIRNQDQRSKDYSHIATSYRPSHADYTYQAKWGHRDYRGGGRSSARETAARVAAGAVAKQLLQHWGIGVQAWVSAVGELELEIPYQQLDLSLTDTNPVRCPEPAMAQRMANYIDTIRKERDTVGGIVSAVITGAPAGLGEPAFGKLHAQLGAAMLGINAVKGFEYGSGFAGIRQRGSQHNDLFYTDDKGQVRTRTNQSGGIQGGISNGEDIYFRVAFKPVATIMQDQDSVNEAGQAVTVSGRGRHDPCVVPRAVPIVEAMAALVLADACLLQRTARL
ncbi:chorismate synthase [Cesiribacter andamanensis]|uniref:Chorismate synthase n=1 Tax=Cesiribacter andamanensis AMV16 TaxID=1279009 RepID=M7NW12_9BACT|nr:chorismate synthase [Cesiribacter andamanensis]EMR02654.1 Chorismate synthase [Cesiribacter andamanensis AMV16]